MRELMKNNLKVVLRILIFALGILFIIRGGYNLFISKESTKVYWSSILQLVGGLLIVLSTLRDFFSDRGYRR